MAQEMSATENTEAQTETVEVDEATLKEATGQGWVPKEKYKGNPEHWVDAELFVKRGREILPIVKKHAETLEKENKQIKEEMQELRLSAAEFRKFQKDAFERKARELEQEITDLKAARAQAITDGDGKKVNALDDAIDTVKDEVKAAKEESLRVVEPPAKPAPTGLDPKLQVWLDKNAWFGQDKKLTAMTNALGESLRLENPSLIGDAFLSRLDEALVEEFPQKFGKKEERTPAYQTESGSGRGRPGASGGKRGYDSLPAEARAACDRFVKQKLMTRESYLSDYDWSE